MFANITGPCAAVVALSFAGLGCAVHATLMHVALCCRVSLVVKHGRSEAEAAGEAAEYLATRLHTEYGAEALPKQVYAETCVYACSQ